MAQNNYGLLLDEKAIKLNRMYFNEMVKLIGIKLGYRATLPGKTWTRYGEIDSNYATTMPLMCIFNEHPDQKTMKKLNWVSELTTEDSLISVPYDTPNLLVGALFEVPGALDWSQKRLFRVVELSTIMIYPASITCKCVPEYEDTFDNALLEHKHDSFNLLNLETMKDLR